MSVSHSRQEHVTTASSNPGADDARFLGLALELALLGRGLTRPNPMVGSVVVRDGEIVGEGHHPRAGLDHAEVIAIARAGAAASAATLYTNLEPCCHHGRTPPCTDRIIEAGLRRVVASVQDPDPRVDGKGFAALRRAGIEVEVGLLAEEARRLNEAYFYSSAIGRPFITVKAATTLDGKIDPGRLPGQPSGPRWVTSTEARAEAMRLRARHDAVLVGVGTVLADDPLLSVREPASRMPIVRAVLDSRLRTPPDCRLLGSPEAGPVIVYHVSGAPLERASALRRAGARTVIAGEGERVDLTMVMEDLARAEILSLLVEGGGQTIESFLRQGLVERVCLFVAPSFLGAGGVSLVGGGPGSETQEANSATFGLDSYTLRRVGPDFLLEGSPARWLRD